MLRESHTLQSAGKRNTQIFLKDDVLNGVDTPVVSVLVPFISRPWERWGAGRKENERILTSGLIFELHKAAFCGRRQPLVYSGKVFPLLYGVFTNWAELSGSSLFTQLSATGFKADFPTLEPSRWAGLLFPEFPPVTDKSCKAHWAHIGSGKWTALFAFKSIELSPLHVRLNLDHKRTIYLVIATLSKGWQTFTHVGLQIFSNISHEKSETYIKLQLRFIAQPIHRI